MQRMIPTLRKICDSAISSLHVCGESGTGKELVSQILRRMIAPQPLVSINCGSITPSLLTSQLFGHRKGAFTGAIGDHVGFFERAQGGWLFLDEISCLDLDAQSALLRVLENKEVIRVGESTPREVTVNVLSASNTPIPRLVAAGTFRLDFWQRLWEMVIEIPPLRERREEIPALIRHFLHHMKGGPYRITEEAVSILRAHPWDMGNVRELRNCLRTMSIHHQERLLTPLSIPSHIWRDDRAQHRERGGRLPEVIEINNLSHGKFNITYEMLNHLLLLECIKENFRHEGRSGVRQFAANFNIPPSTLSRKLKTLIDYNLVTPQELATYLTIKPPTR